MREGEFEKRIKKINSRINSELESRLLEYMQEEQSLLCLDPFWEIVQEVIKEVIEEARREFPKSHPFNDLDIQIGYEEEEINKWFEKWFGIEEKEEVE